MEKAEKEQLRAEIETLRKEVYKLRNLSPTTIQSFSSLLDTCARKIGGVLDDPQFNIPRALQQIRTFVQMAKDSTL